MVKHHQALYVGNEDIEIKLSKIDRSTIDATEQCNKIEEYLGVREDEYRAKRCKKMSIFTKLRSTFES